MANAKEFELAIFKIDRRSSVIETLIRYGSLSLIALFVWLSIRDLAGRQTFADIGIRFFASVKISEGLAYLFGAGGISYGLGERRLRRNRVEVLSKRLLKYEQEADPTRTSSQLTPRGTTRKGD